MSHGTMDFETYSEAGYRWDDDTQKWRSPIGFANAKRGIEVVGTHNYVNHPTFRPLSLCYDLHTGTGVQRWIPPDDLQPIDVVAIGPPPGHAQHSPTDHGPYADARHPWALLKYIENGGMIEAHYVGFEHTVWEWCVANWGWPEWPLSQQLCSAAKARASAYPGALDPLCVVLDVDEKKDPAGKRLIRKLTVPRNPTKKNKALRWVPATAPEDFEQFYQYNEQDVRSEAAASARIPDLTPHEREVWELDQTINRRGMAIDRAGVENCIAIVEQATERARRELYTLTQGAVQAHTEVAATLRWFAYRGFHLHELDEDTVSESLKRTDLAPDIRRVLEIRKALSFGSVKKLYAMREQTSADGRLRDQYIYHGAHTSLWNGRGVQPANLPRPFDARFESPAEVEKALRVIACRSIELLELEYPTLEPLEVVASCLRSLIVASPGHRLISADYTAIQAVVTSALAGEEWRLEVFRTHGKIYETMASQLTGKPLDYYVNYKREHGHHHDDRQTYGKIPVLSADFGAWINGWKRFGADKVIGDDDAIKRLILQTRAKIPNIVELWGGQTRDKFQYSERQELYGLEGAAVCALLEPGRAFEYRGIVYQKHGDALYCRPPSGGFITYHNADLYPSTRPYARPWEYEISYEGWNSNPAKGAPGWRTMNLYGGVQTQNVVSHESREIQALALLRIERSGYPLVMHTHDENVTEVPLNSEHSIAEHTRLTAELPSWAVTPDGRPWPIQVPESWECSRYGKW